MKHVEAAAPTCTADGNKEYWYCENCRSYFFDKDGKTDPVQKEDTILKATGHTADGTGWHTDKNGHWNACACGEKLNEAAHTLEWVTDKEATATQAGEKHEECTVCGYKLAAVEIPALGTPSPAPSTSPEATTTPAPTVTPAPTATPAPSATPEATASPTPTAAPETTATPAPTATPEPGIGPQTGDAGVSALWFLLPALSALGLTGTATARRKKSR